MAIKRPCSRPTAIISLPLLLMLQCAQEGVRKAHNRGGWRATIQNNLLAWSSGPHHIAGQGRLPRRLVQARVGASGGVAKGWENRGKTSILLTRQHRCNHCRAREGKRGMQSSHMLSRQ